MWQPDLNNSNKPCYLALADAIASGIADGQLAEGARLPTHRDLATRLRVTVGTVSRAYREAEQRGLIRGEVGRGTFVRGLNPEPTSFAFRHQTQNGLIDLSLNRPAIDPILVDAFRKALVTQASHENLCELLSYQPAEGMPSHRLAGALWMKHSGLEVRPEQVIVTHGGQHALFIALSALTKPGDTVLAEKLTYPGVKTIANQLHLTLRGLEMDEQGIVPDAFEAACKLKRVRVLACIPNLQNPTAATMSVERRQQLVAIARTHDVMLVEDDVYGFLLTQSPPPPPLALMAPERTYYFTSLAKSILPGIRVGYLYVPDENRVEKVGAVIRSTTWMVSPPLVELAAQWIYKGTAQILADWQRAEAEARQGIAARILNRWTYQAGASGLHLWLPLPSPWRTDDFVHWARAGGVKVTPAGSFAADRFEVPHAVRVCVSAAASRAQLEKALTTLDHLLSERPGPWSATI
jgi:DNA-binding transcriptional MocR family regulator